MNKRIEKIVSLIEYKYTEYKNTNFINRFNTYRIYSRKKLDKKGILIAETENFIPFRISEGTFSGNRYTNNIMIFYKDKDDICVLLWIKRFDEVLAYKKRPNSIKRRKNIEKIIPNILKLIEKRIKEEAI